MQGLLLAKVPSEDILLNDYQILEELGSGSQGTVYKAYNKEMKEIVAIKALADKSLGVCKRLIGSNGYHIKTELAILKKISHPNLIKFIEVIDDTNQNVLFIVTEYIQGRALLDENKLLQGKASVFKEEVAQVIFWKLLDAVGYLHSVDICHKDIKPENVLLIVSEETPNVKLCDFGVASFTSNNKGKKILGVDDITYADAGTVLFLPPEALISTFEGYNGRPGDVYSLGVTLYSMLFGRLPYYDKRAILKAQFSLKHKYNQISTQAKNFLRRVLERNPNKRPTCSDLMKDVWLSRFKPAKIDKIIPTEDDIESSVSKLFRIENFLINSTKRQEREFQQINKELDEEIGPAMNDLSLNIHELESLVQTKTASQDSAGQSEFPAICFLTGEKHFDQEIFRTAVLNPYLIEQIEEFLNELRRNGENEVLWLRGILRKLNNYFPLAISLHATDNTLRTGQKQEVAGMYFDASQSFGKFGDFLNKELTHIEKRDSIDLNNKIVYNKKAIWLLGNELEAHAVPAMKIRIVIIGGGYAGFAVAKQLENLIFVDNESVDLNFNFSIDTAAISRRKRYFQQKNFKFELLVVEPRGFLFHKMGSIRAATIGNAFCHRVHIPNNNCLSYGEILQDKVTQIDTNSRKITTANKNIIPFDFLVAATGSSNVSICSNQFASFVKSEEHFEKISSIIAVSNHITVVGSGPVAIELCGEIVSFDNNKCVTLLTNGAGVLEGYKTLFSEDFVKSTAKCLINSGVNIFTSPIKNWSRDLRKLYRHYPNPITLELLDASSMWCDLLINCLGNKPNNTCYPSHWVNSEGRLRTNNYLQVPDCNSVFVAGDISATDDFRNISSARAQGVLVAKNIVAQVCQEKMRTYQIQNKIFTVALGSNRGSTFSSGRIYGSRMSSQTKGKFLQVNKYWKFMNVENKLKPELNTDTISSLRRRLNLLREKLDSQSITVDRLKHQVKSLQEEQLPEEISYDKIMKLVDCYNRQIQVSKLEFKT